MIFLSLIPINSVVFIPNDGLVAFHYSSYGTFCVHSKSSIIPTVVLPTTEIIEPEKLTSREDLIGLLFLYVQSDENTLPKVNKVSKTEAQTFDAFDQLISRFKFRV